MSQTIPVTYRQPGAAPTAEMHLPLIDKSAITVLADITYSNSERVLLFFHEGSVAYCEARSMETCWPGALFGSRIDTPVDPRDAMILDLGEEGVFVCRSGQSLPFVHIDRWSAELLRISWMSFDEVADCAQNGIQIDLHTPEAKEMVREAGIKASVSEWVCDPSLIETEDRVEDELLDMLEEIEDEAGALNRFACGTSVELPEGTGESGLLDRAQTQARTLCLLRKSMSERIEL